MTSWGLQRPIPDDARRTLDLMVRCDISEYGEPDTDLEDLLFEWDQIEKESVDQHCADPRCCVPLVGLPRLSRYDHLPGVMANYQAAGLR